MRYVRKTARRLPEVQGLSNLFSQSVPGWPGSRCKEGQLVVVDDNTGC